ncbi:MAG: sigma 54-interacting transcriptional regulator [Cyclobacteriaceae bacterium]|nr:sigma 54-interacting transcriptional regulator [Cyclobacteriaceae bacterium]
MSYYNLTAEQLMNIRTLGELKASGYQPRPVKEELRANLIQKIKQGVEVFPGIWGYEETVIPDLERAVLSRHNINLLGLRGQAKTRLARQMVELLDPLIPIIEGSELNDDPLLPISSQGREVVSSMGDKTPVAWLPRENRYTEKLATPDVSIADLIGDVDPIKAASLKLPYSDPKVIHYGLVPRSHRGIFVINELPDLQARIQVALFNILQEGDIQIRGFKLRLPLDIQFIFTANPEDYTNRGSIVTPLKDRIDSQVITHYPKSLEISKKITQQEARLKEEQKGKVLMNAIAEDLVEQIAIEARDSEYVDEKSGVSARLTISAYENLWSAAERRALRDSDHETAIRISDFVGVIPAITGKVELVYEGEQEGAGIVAYNLIGKAIRSQFLNFFPNPEDFRKKKEESPFKKITDYFGDGHTIDLFHDDPDSKYQSKLKQVPGLMALVKKYQPDAADQDRFFLMEFALHGLAEYSLLSKNPLVSGLQFKDLLSGMFTMPDLEDDDFDEL